MKNFKTSIKAVINNGTGNASAFLVSDNGVIKYRNTVELLTDLRAISGTGTAGWVPKFQTGGVSLTDSPILINGSNVEIRLTAPSFMLSASGHGAISTIAFNYIVPGRTEGAAWTLRSVITGGGSLSTDYEVGSFIVSGRATNTSTTLTDYVTILSNGNIGFGISPTEKAHFYTPSANNYILSETGSAGHAAGFAFKNNINTAYIYKAPSTAALKFNVDGADIMTLWGNRVVASNNLAVDNGAGISFCGEWGANNSNQGLWWHSIGNSGWGAINRSAINGDLLINSQNFLALNSQSLMPVNIGNYTTAPVAFVHIDSSGMNYTVLALQSNDPNKNSNPFIQFLGILKSDFSENMMYNSDSYYVGDHMIPIIGPRWDYFSSMKMVKVLDEMGYEAWMPLYYEASSKE